MSYSLNGGCRWGLSVRRGEDVRGKGSVEIDFVFLTVSSLFIILGTYFSLVVSRCRCLYCGDYKCCR